MRLILPLLTLSALGMSGWYVWDNVPFVRTFVEEKIDTRQFCTLEIRHTAEQIVRSNQEMLEIEGQSFSKPKLLYAPYLLMDVKYSKTGTSTSEGILLWSLTDGEMVLNPTTWEKTHGFEDCLLSKANKNDFKILKVLIASGGAVDREQIYCHFNIEHDVLDDWIESCRQKKLIVIGGNKFRLHFENPHLVTQPVALVGQHVVNQPRRYTNVAKSAYTPSQIRRLAETVFEGDFAIRKVEEVFLPVYSIGIQNPDGSVRTVHFNALTGGRTHDQLHF